MITRLQVMERLIYDASTGKFIHKTNSVLRKSGDEAGYLDPRGFRTIRVLGEAHYAHRLAWLVVFGAWPTRQLDHKDRDQDNNRIKNLREATDSQNRANSVCAIGVSGIRGVSFYAPRGKWRARIKKNRTEIYLGYFETRQRAEAAYKTARKKLFGEFCPL